MLHNRRGCRQARTAPGGLPLQFLVAIILFVPVLTGTLSLLENLRSGDVSRQRALCPGGLALGICRAFVNSVWTLWLTALALPLGRFMPRAGAGARRRGDRPTVILVHGLYHNPAAWFVMRGRLARAGFVDVRCYGYPSFGREFVDIAAGLADSIRRAAADAACGRVLLVGHSLGGLVIRAACADAEIAGMVAGVATLGTPHRGSTLAGVLGIGRLARGLAPQGRVLRLLRTLPPFPGPGLSLYTPTDGMVLPLAGLLLTEREAQARWREAVLPPMSHVGLLYSRAAAREVIAFFEECRRG